MDLPLWLVTAVVLGLMLILLVLRMPVAFALLFVAILGLLLVSGPRKTWLLVSYTPFRSVESIFFLVVPMFVLMGQLLYFSGLSAKLFEFGNAWVGHIRGGLGMAAVVAAAFFAAANGSSSATAAAIGSVAVPEMRARGYHQSLATAVCAAGGTLGVLIPPSTTFVIYGLITGASIARLLVSGILPGILAAGGYMLAVYLTVKIRPSMAPATARASWGVRLRLTPAVAPFLALFAIVMGGIYFGVMTPGEAGAVGGVGTMAIVALSRRLKPKVLWQSTAESIQVSVMVFAIFMAAMVLGAFITQSGLAVKLSNMIIGAGLSRLSIVGIILVFYLIIGCFMEVASVMMVVLPFLLPTLQSLHVDMIWLGVLTVRAVEVGLITPPFGLNVFVLKSTVPDVSTADIFRGVLPFVLADLAVIGVLFAFPQISTFLPSRMWT